MKPSLTLIGAILIMIGLATVAYQGFSYKSREDVAQLGSVKVSAETEKTVDLPPILGGISIVGGVILLVIGNMNKNRKI